MCYEKFCLCACVNRWSTLILFIEIKLHEIESRDHDIVQMHGNDLSLFGIKNWCFFLDRWLEFVFIKLLFWEIDLENLKNFEKKSSLENFLTDFDQNFYLNFFL